MLSRRHLTPRRLLHEQFESRLVLSSVAFVPHDITALAKSAQTVMAADVDGDGDVDVLSASRDDGKIAWYQNTDGAGTFGPQKVITNQADGALSVYAADLDGDGDLDALSASRGDAKIAWYENTDGVGTFEPHPAISNQVEFVRSVYAADLDGDGDVDVLSASSYDNKIAWYENTDGAGTFGPQKVITNQADGARSVHAVDLDGDGDIDVCSASHDDGKIAWYENTDGLGTFGQPNVISTDADRATLVLTADLDGDGDWDALSAASEDDTFAWYENMDGQGAFGSQQLIFRADSLSWVNSVDAADVDGDGDLDVVAAAELDHELYWFENIDGQGTFGPPQVKATEGPGYVHAADVDGDGDMDIVAASFHEGTVVWFENRRVGDSNDDGIFDSADLVLVLSAGEYLDDVPNNSTYDEGDWNGDGEFDTRDLVLAFQASTYAVAPALATHRVSAAADWIFAAHDDETGRRRTFAS